MKQTRMLKMAIPGPITRGQSIALHRQHRQGHRIDIVTHAKEVGKATATIPITIPFFPNSPIVENTIIIVMPHGVEVKQ